MSEKNSGSSGEFMARWAAGCSLSRGASRPPGRVRGASRGTGLWASGRARSRGRLLERQRLSHRPRLPQNLRPLSLSLCSFLGIIWFLSGRKTLHSLIAKTGVPFLRMSCSQCLLTLPFPNPSFKSLFATSNCRRFKTTSPNIRPLRHFSVGS